MLQTSLQRTEEVWERLIKCSELIGIKKMHQSLWIKLLKEQGALIYTKTQKITERLSQYGKIFLFLHPAQQHHRMMPRNTTRKYNDTLLLCQKLIQTHFARYYSLNNQRGSEKMTEAQSVKCNTPTLLQSIFALHSCTRNKERGFVSSLQQHPRNKAMCMFSTRLLQIDEE